MPENYERRNDREYEERITAILRRQPDTIGVRVEAAPAAGSVASGPDGRNWVPYDPAPPRGVGGGEPEDADPPVVLLYDKRRLAVRDNVWSQFAEFYKLEPDARAVYPGLDGVSIVDVSVRGDAYDVMTEFYDDRAKPEPPPIGQYDPFVKPRTVDAVSLIRHYLTTSHVFFWPQNRKTKSDAVLPAADWGDNRVVVVIDTGINPDHAFLATGPGTADYLRNAATDAEWGGGGIDDGHGTGVAAVVRQHNAMATIFGARVQLGQGQVDTVEETEIVKAIDYVLWKFANDQRLVVLNLSFGGPVFGTSALYAKIQAFVGANRRVVAAAGNLTHAHDRRPMQPAAWPIVYAVASHDEHGNIHTWSNGDTQDQVWVDTLRNGEVETADGSTQSDVVRWRGTSFAAPQVAATI